jgi:cupin superfamily acireductone dioxygenase involved in methionine salvage
MSTIRIKRGIMSDIVKSDLKKLKEQGAKVIELSKVDEDVKDIYNRLVNSLANKNEFENTDFIKINTILAIKKDKQDMIKFLLEQDRKEREMEIKYSEKAKKNAVMDVTIDDNTE